MSERLEKIADEILAVVNKKRVSGETPEKDVWVATYLPNREQIAVIFGDREVSGSYVQKRFNKDDKQSIISTLEQLYGAEPRNHNEEGLDEDTVYDHSWYEVEDGDYPKRTKEGVMIKEEDLEETCSCVTTGAGAVCETPDSVASVKKSVSKVTKSACPSKRKHKKVSDDIHSKLFKESILNDMPCEAEVEGHQFKYFMNEDKWYLSADNCLVKTHDKGVMMETFDQIVDDEKVTTSLLEDYSCYEMELLMEEENTLANPDDPDSPLVQGPSNNELAQPGIANIDDQTTQVLATASALKTINDKKKNDINEPLKTSEQIQKDEEHKQELKTAKNQEVTVVKDGKSIQAKNDGIVDTGIKDKNNNDISMVKLTYKDGSTEFEEPENVNMNQETLE